MQECLIPHKSWLEISNMCKLTESTKSGHAEVDTEQQPELRPIWVVAKVYYGTKLRLAYTGIHFQYFLPYVPGGVHMESETEGCLHPRGGAG
jgi:hypothetical protein